MRGESKYTSRTKKSGIGGTGRMQTSNYQLEATNSISNSFSMGSIKNERRDEKLDMWENRLECEVDPDFFQDPKTFPTLHRVIDVLGAQLASNQATETNNPAYVAMKKQQKIVEDAIDHMAVSHYAEFNASVVAVGSLSRQFTGAHTQVRALRRQVRDIKDNLANSGIQKDSTDSGQNNIVSAEANNKPSATPDDETDVMSNSISLRELWLKKLECEAVLSLLHKLEVVREAPMAFDTLIRNLRIGAAVVLLMNGISTSFEDDVAQVKALHKIVDQLMTRKQRALDIVWDTLANVLYLRTGNNDEEEADENSNIKNKQKKKKKAIKDDSSNNNNNNNNNNNTTIKEDDNNDEEEDDYEEDDEDEEYQYSFNNYDSSKKTDNSNENEDKRGQRSIRNQMKELKGISHSTYNLVYTLRGYEGQLLPKPVIESELDLEVDEMRCLDMSSAATSNNATAGTQQNSNNLLPRYNDPVMALRILVECLHRLNRLIDVDTTLVENVDVELRKIAELEQAKTFERMERRSNMKQSKSRGNGIVNNAEVIDDMVQQEIIFKDFRIHLTNLLKAYGNITKRLSFLAQILRHKLSMDRTTSSSMASSALHSVLTTAMCAMQREIKQFLICCLHPEDTTTSSTSNTNSGNNKSNNNRQTGRSGNVLNMEGVSSYEQGMFSLGIITEDDHPTIRGRTGQFYKLGPGQSNTSSLFFPTASRTSVLSMSMEDFVKKVLFPRTNASANYHNALFFRQSVANFTRECDELSKELIHMTTPPEERQKRTKIMDDSSPPTAVDFLDNIIHTKLLPVMQNDATMALVSALEKTDAFDPPIGVLYNNRKAVRGAMGVDVGMCLACQTLFDSTGPLFFAMQRVPHGGEMYTPLVAVLEHALLTFNSRVSKRVEFVCRNKTATVILDGSSSSFSQGSGKKKQSEFSTEMESRKTYQQLIQSYFDDPDTSVDLRSSAQTTISSSHAGSVTLSSTDSKESSQKNKLSSSGAGNKDQANQETDNGDPLAKEKEVFENEMTHIKHLGDFSKRGYGDEFQLCSEDDFMKAANLAHSLLKLASLMDLRLGGKSKTRGSLWGKSSKTPRTLKDAIRTIRSHGLRMAKFCRVEILLHTFRHMSQIFKSSTLLSKDVVRLPPCVNDFGEFLATISDSLREAAGNTIAGYSLSSLEQYIPICLIQTVRIVATGNGLPAGFIISLNGIESLDRSGSVLYRDLKGATQFENSFWDEDIAADSFEYSASFIAMMEWDMDELISFFRDNREHYDEEDIKLMFAMDGPRRKGDYSRYKDLQNEIVKQDFKDIIKQVTKKGKDT